MMFKSKQKKINKRRQDQLRHLAQSVRLEETTSSAVVRLTIFIIFTAIVVFVIWASNTSIEEIARAQGDIVPRGKPKVVQHLEGGIVSDILVKNGDIVQEGQLVLTLSDVSAEKDLDRVDKKLLSLTLQEIRLDAIVSGEQPDFGIFEAEYPALVVDQISLYEASIEAEAEEREVLIDQIEQKKNAITLLETQVATTQTNLNIIRELFVKRKTLKEEGIISEVRFLETKQRLNDLEGRLSGLEGQIETARVSQREFEGRLETLDAKNRDEDRQKLDAARQELQEARETIQSLQDRVKRLNIRAPVHGVVKGLIVNTIGSIIQSGDIIMEVLPLDAQLVAQVKIDPDSIGYVKESQRVKIKVSTYDFSRYGTVNGTLEFISATTFEDYDGSRFYEGRIQLDNDYVGNNESRKILPGMTVIADIITGKKTIMQYLLKPITISLQTAFTER